MTDKIQKIREEVERLKSQLLRGACSSQIAMETRCKEEAYNEVLAILDTMQEEPANEDLEEAAKRYSDNENPICTCAECLLKSFKDGAEWQKQQVKKEAVSATIVSDLDPHGADYGNQKIICGWGELEAKKFKNGSKVKLIIIKED